MTAIPQQAYRASSRNNPCPICGRTKDGSCSISDSLLHCHFGKTHQPPELKVGETVEGEDHQIWAFTGNTSDGRAATFTLHKPRVQHHSSSVVVPFPARELPLSTRLARLPEPAEQPPEHWANGEPLLYSDHQKVVVVVGPNSKAHMPWHCASPGSWSRGAGPSHWPLWAEEDAIHHGPGHWIVEAEGEKCAEWFCAAGFVAVSQPGHAHTPPEIQRRYQRLKDAGVEGIAYLSDNDKTGHDKASRCKKAAVAVGLGFAWIKAEDVWSDLPSGGSIDDAQGSPSNRVAAFQQALDRPQPQQQPDSTPPAASSPLDEWEHILKGLVDPSSITFERNTVRRQIKAQTIAAEQGLRLSFPQVRSRLLALQRELINGTAEKGTKGGQVARFKAKEFLINGLITKRCLTAVAAFAKVGKTKFLSELAASLVFQRPFMGNPEWTPAPGPHKLILWWTDQPGADSEGYLKAVGLMEPNGRLHPQVVCLFTEDDDLSWDDQGLDHLLQLLDDNPDAVLLTDSFFANIQRLHGTDNEPEAGGTLIDLQTLLSQYGTTHVCAFHSPKEIGPVGINAIRGHSSAAGAVSAAISLHFLEKRDPQGNGKWVPDKENPHRRLVFEGRGPYQDLLIRGDWANGSFQVVGDFTKELAALTADDRRAETLDRLTEGQQHCLEALAASCAKWKREQPDGITVAQVADHIAANYARPASVVERENTRKQLNSLVKKGLVAAKRSGRTHLFTPRS